MILNPSAEPFVPGRDYGAEVAGLSERFGGVYVTVAAGTRAQLPTGLLNRVIGDAYEAVKPPSSGRRHFKIFYATQTGNEPLRIRIFVNDAKIPGANYTAYLVKALRAAFGLEGVPVVVDYYNRARGDDDAPKPPRPDARGSKPTKSKSKPKAGQGKRPKSCRARGKRL